MVKLFIGGLPDNVQEMELAIICSLHGTVDTVKIVRDKISGKCKGYAFLEIPDLSQADNIIANLNGEPFKGNLLTVKRSEEKNTGSAPKRESSGPSKSKRPRLQR